MLVAEVFVSHRLRREIEVVMTREPGGARGAGENDAPEVAIRRRGDAVAESEQLVKRAGSKPMLQVLGDGCGLVSPSAHRQAHDVREQQAWVVRRGLYPGQQAVER